METLGRRGVNLAGFGICAALLAYAYYTQFHDLLDPCPLCIFQRIAMIALGLVFLVAAVHDPRPGGSRLYGALIALVAIIGAAVAARQVWIQHLPPDRIPACGPSLNYLLETFPLGDALRMAFTGSGDCATVSWTFLGLSMPEWVLMWFLALGALGLARNWKVSS